MPNYDFPTQPVADDDAIIPGPNYRFTIINDVVLRYEWAADGIFEDRASTFAINRRFSHRPTPVIKDTEDGLEIITPAIHLYYDKKRFSPNGFIINLQVSTNLWGTEWRYSHGQSNLGGTARTLDGVDGRCNMGAGVLSKDGFSVIDDSGSMLFSDDGFVQTRRPGDRVDGYFFAYGQNFKGAMQAFFDISGHTPRLPRWNLGNWWSRYHSYTADSYLALMDEFQEANIPLSVAVIDMDWHLVHEKEVTHTGWTGYTWNKRLFPDPVKFADALHDRNLKMTLNDHPHGGVGPHEEQYEKMARFLGHDTSDKTTILFDPTNPRYMEGYFGILHKALEEKGCDFWWIDWQQGSISRIPGIDPLWLLNHFQYLDTKQKAGAKDALVFSRYAGPGSHRYPIGFSGDSIVSWNSLAFQPEFTATASNIGYGWWSHDIGGHVGGSRDDELVTRWVQLGVMSPIMRLHSSNNQWMSKEPWNYRRDANEVMSFFMKLRHRLIPYLYTGNVSFAQDDQPLVQPLYWHYPKFGVAFRYPNEYFFGPSLLVAPIVQPIDHRTQLAAVKVWLPPSAPRHVDIFTGTVYNSDRETELWRTLREIPVLAPEGSIIPLDAAAEPVNGGGNPDDFELLVVVGRDGEYTIVEDRRDDNNFQPTDEPESVDSSNKLRSIPIKWHQESGTLTVHAPASRGWTVRFLSMVDRENLSRIKVHIDDSPVVNVIVTIDPIGHPFPGTVVQLPKDALEFGGTLTVKLGSDPQLSVLNSSDRMRSLLFDFQIPFHSKDDILGIIQARQPLDMKLYRLQALNLEHNILGPILELLTADSRT